MKIRKIFFGAVSAARMSIRRFPVVYLLFILSALVLIFTVHSFYLFPEEEQDNIRMLSALLFGAVFAFSAEMVSERTGFKSLLRHILWLVVSAGVTAACFFFLYPDISSMPSGIRYACIMAAVLATGLVAHYIPKRKGLGLYATRIFTRALTSALYSGVIYGGIAAIYFAIDNLLGIEIKSELYADTGIIVALVFTPVFFLSGYPEYDREPSEKDMPALLRILIFYILMPLCTAYAFILYIYFFRVIITHIWPSGLVAHLVIWFSAIVLAVLFISAPVMHGKKWPLFFNRVFPFLMLPLLAMMFISLGIRMNAYGVTVNRYFVAAGGAWAAACMIYRCLSQFMKRDNAADSVWMPSDTVMPALLVLVLVISVVGPFSSFSVSYRSQTDRLEERLTDIGVLSAGKITAKAEGDQVPKEKAGEITSIISYLDNNEMIGKVSYLPDDFGTEKMKDLFGFEPAYSWDIDVPEMQRYFYFNGSAGPYDTGGYDQLLIGYSYYSGYDNEKYDPVPEEKEMAESGDSSDSLKLRIINDPEEKGTALLIKDEEVFASIDFFEIIKFYLDEGILIDDSMRGGIHPKIEGEIVWTKSYEKADINIIFRMISGTTLSEKQEGEENRNGNDNDNNIFENLSVEYLMLINLKEGSNDDSGGGESGL